MSGTRPSEFEQLLLLATWRLEEEAYGLSIRDELAQRAGRHIAVGAVYSTMIRLEKKGWVRSHLSDPTPVRGGKSKRFFQITDDGRQVVEEARAVMDTAWEGLRGAHPKVEEA